jgi:glycosyltransferase 2 family protein
LEDVLGFKTLRKAWKGVAVIILLGLAVYLILPQLTDLESSWKIIRGMVWWWVLLAVGAQILSYLGAGFMLYAILENSQQKLSILNGVLITLASASIGLVAGGWVGDAMAIYSWVHYKVNDKTAATLAGILPPILNTVILVAVAAIGIVYLLVVHDLSQIQLIAFGIILLFLVIVICGIIYALYFQERAIGLGVQVANRWSLLRKKPFDKENTVKAMTQFFDAWKFLENGRWRRPVFGAIANIFFDILTLYFLFLASGYNINPSILIAGYGLPFILAKIAFLFPGGLGVIEGSMVALYTSLQIPNAVCVVVVLGYRIFSFWIPVLLGFGAVFMLSNKSDSPKLENA